jgi:hypothetical protein
MVATKILIMASVITIALSVDLCRPFRCDDLDSDLCAVISDTEIVVNEDKCGKEMCHLWIAKAFQNLPFYTEYPCEDDDTDTEEDEVEEMVTCGANSQKVLATGTYPKACSTSSECKLKDGTNGDCACSIDGNYWCKPHTDDPNVQSFYWDICALGGNQWTTGIKGIRDLVMDIVNDYGKISCYD